MNISAQQIAQWLNGEIIGNPDVFVNNISKIEEGKPETICFLSNEKYKPYLENNQSSIVIISRDLVPKSEVSPTLIVVDDAYASFLQVLNAYQENIKAVNKGISEQAFIADSAEIAEEVYIESFAVISDNSKVGAGSKIYANAYIGRNVTIGENVTIEPNVVIFDGCEIHKHVIIHSGTIIGSDGFGFVPSENGYDKVPQLGNVIVESNVEIGSNCTIDRATMGSTIIKEGAKLDNLIQIAHNVEIGKHTVIAAQAGIAGSTKVGEWNMIGGQVGIVGHIKIGDKVKIQAQSGVNKNVKDEASLYGSPAIDAMEFRKNYVIFKNLQQLTKTVEDLKKEIAELKNNKA